MTSCPHDGGAPCAWEARFQHAQNGLLLAQYEAKRWKEKCQQEKQRRRKLARSLLDTMALLEEGRRTPVSPSQLKRTRRSSSTFSDMDQIDSLLSPTLSSFDFDDDDDDEEEEDADDGDKNDDERDGANGLVHRSGDAAKHSEPAGPARNGDSRARASFPRATSHREVRQTRSSTVGGTFDAGYARNGVRRNGNSTLPPPSNVLYRMLYSKPSSRDLWSAQTSKLHSVARSVMFSMQLKKEHVFEHFFITGMSIGKAERDQAARSPTGLVGFWKPKVFYEFAQRAGRPPDPIIADFCFPVGVPVVKCKPHQASSLLGSPVSIWTTDADRLQKHTLDRLRSSGYTFRLTGAKGEVLYGFCVAVMSELVAHDDTEQHQAPLSPRNDYAKRASCPNGSVLRLSEPLRDNHGPSSSPRREIGKDTRGSDATGASTYLAPMCYCFTSKFPFYKLHFTLLRLIIENDIRFRQNQSSNTARPSDLYELTLTVESDLGVEFAVCRQPTSAAPSNPSEGASPTSVSMGGSLASVSSGVHKDGLSDAVLSEESPSTIPSTPHSPGLQAGAVDVIRHHSRRSGSLKKSFSSDDITSYRSSSSCVVEKPVVVRLNGPLSPRVAAQIQVGDVLEAIDGVSTASLTFDEALELLKHAPRPLKLRFHRLKSREMSEPLSSPSSKACHVDSNPIALVPTSADILLRARRLRIGDPGQWTALRLPDYAISYQFPKRDAERWAVGVVLRTLEPANVVKILAHLLLEKQVVVVGANSAHASAVCTALLLLLAPFQWQSTYIPQLPASLLDFLHSPVPFLVGCQPLQSTDEWPDVCFFDVDANVILAPITDHHISPKSIPNGDELLRLFQGAAQRYHRVRSASKPWHELSDEEDKIITLTQQESQIFLKDICSELTSLHLRPADGKSFYARLQEEVATIVRKSTFEDFLEEFSQTQLFCQYCETTLNAEKGEEATALAAHHAPR